MEQQSKKLHFKAKRLKGFEYQGFYRYFLTFCVEKRQPLFKSQKLVDFIRHALFKTAEEWKLDIICFCFMPDHLHLLISGLDESSDLRGFIKNFKQKTGYAFKQNTGRKLWQRSFYDHILRGEEETYDISKYILENPVRKGIVEDYRDYPFSWCKYFELKDGDPVI